MNHNINRCGLASWCKRFEYLVGVVEPVLLSGSTITRASLANLFNIRKEISVLVIQYLSKKANDVIPQIIKPIVDERDGSEIRSSTT